MSDEEEKTFKRRFPAFETTLENIDPEKHQRVMFVASIIEIDHSSGIIAVDDGTKKVNVISPENEMIQALKPGDIVFVIGTLLIYTGGFEINAEIIKQANKLNLDIYKKYLDFKLNQKS